MSAVSIRFLIADAVEASIASAHASGIASVQGGTVWEALRDATVRVMQEGKFSYGVEGKASYKKWESEGFKEYVEEGIGEGKLPEELAKKGGKVGRQLWVTSEGEYISPPKNTEEKKKYREDGIVDAYGKYTSAASTIGTAIELGINIEGKGKSMVAAEIKAEKEKVVDKKEKEESEKVSVPDEILAEARRFVSLCEEDRQLIYTAIAKAMAS